MPLPPPGLPKMSTMLDSSSGAAKAWVDMKERRLLVCHVLTKARDVRTVVAARVNMLIIIMKREKVGVD